MTKRVYLKAAHDIQAHKKETHDEAAHVKTVQVAAQADGTHIRELDPSTPREVCLATGRSQKPRQQQAHSHRLTTSDGKLANQAAGSGQRAQSEAKTGRWSLRAISNYFFSRNLPDENRSTHKISRTDEVNGAEAIKQVQSGEEPDESVSAPEEREAWRFVDTVYETTLTRVS